MVIDTRSGDFSFRAGWHNNQPALFITQDGQEHIIVFHDRDLARTGRELLEIAEHLNSLLPKKETRPLVLVKT